MNSKQLVSSALQGLPVSRVPVGPLAVHFCAGIAGYNLRQYTTNARALAESVICYYERFKPDAIWVSADTWVSAEAMGVKVGAHDDHQPFGRTGEPLIHNAADLDRIPNPDVASQGRYPLMLEALSHIVDALGHEVFVVACFDQYPFSLAAALMDINEIMLKVLDDPPFVQALMHRCSEFALAYARGLSSAGAELLSGGDSPAGLLGPQLYQELAFPAERNLISAVKTATGKPVSLHICGDATPLLPAMAATGADVLELDHAVDLATAFRTVGPGVGIWGNLDPVGSLARGTPLQVRQESTQVISTAKAHAHRRLVLSSGCTLAVETPEANLHALIDASRSNPAF